MKIKLLLPMLLVMGLVFAAGCTSQTPSTGDDNVQPPEETRTASLSVADQKLAVDKISIASAYLDKAGFVVVHKDVGGTPGQVLGSSELISGERTDVKVPVDPTQVGTKVHAMLHYDSDGDGIYKSVDKDAPVTVGGAVVVKAISIIETTPGTPGPVIDMTSEGFSPKTVTIKAGQIVIFKNSDTVKHWPASAVHPTHAVYPEGGGCIGSAFDACLGLEPGASWSFTFNQKGSWNYHDHLNPSLVGTIRVE